MKHMLLFAIFVFSVSCVKDPVVENNGLLGSWEWTSTSGSIAGITITPESTGTEQSLEITEEKLSFYLDGQLNQELTYTTYVSDTIYGGNMLFDFIRYNETTRRYLLEDDELIFYDLCDDCYQDNYKR